MSLNDGNYKSLATVFCLMLPVVAMAAWTAARHAGGISHAEVTIVHSTQWDAGETKRCTTINGNGAGAPELPSKARQNIVCDGGGSGDQRNAETADEKVSKVLFQGETFLMGRDLNAVLSWNCRKTSPDENAVISCERAR
jgi:hypothetical protein